MTYVALWGLPVLQRKCTLKLILPPILFGYDLFTPNYTRGMFWHKQIIAKLYWGYVLAMKFICQICAWWNMFSCYTGSTRSDVLRYVTLNRHQIHNGKNFDCYFGIQCFEALGDHCSWPWTTANTFRHEYLWEKPCLLHCLSYLYLFW